MSPDRITLLYFGDARGNTWPFGPAIQVARHPGQLLDSIRSTLRSNNADWIFIWDYTLGAPDVEVINSLTMRPVDVWHAGLQLGLGGLPDVINYVHPTWMYNKNAPVNVEHSSFRLSTGACLIKTKALSAMPELVGEYETLTGFGIALGYKLLRIGAIIRYTPQLVSNTMPTVTMPLEDEWAFAKEFFPLKWQLWTLFNKPGFLSSGIKRWRQKHLSQAALHPCIHSSDEKPSQVAYETVSVLAPTLNRYSYLLNELEQLSRQTILPLEVLITDQTDEKDRQILDFSRFPNLAIRYFPQNEKGQCIAWNKLLHEAKGDLVLFLGDDADDIKPGFIEKLLATRQKFDCDMVAANVIEIGMPEQPVNHHYYMSDTFPITLIRRSVVDRAGFMDMFYNKNIRADHDLAMRCHLNGALMVFDSSAVILHHRAPSGGLRTHNARVITNHISKNSLTKFAIPASSEIYLAKKYYSPLQYKNYIRIKYLNQLFIKGNTFKKLMRGALFLYKLPLMIRSHRANELAAQQSLPRSISQP